MKKVIYLLFISIFLFDHFHFRLQLIPRYLTWAPEVLSMLVFSVMALYFAHQRPFFIQSKYIYLIAGYLVVMLVGVLFNSTPAGSVVIGLRVYLKGLPFFLLPAMVDFSEDQFKRQLLFILPLLLVQCPMALYQRLFQFSGMLTGDVIRGTLMISSVLSITMICSIAVALGFWLTKRISSKHFITMASCLFLPTTLNETKGTLILLPIALLLPTLICGVSIGSKKMKKVVSVALVAVLFIAAFIPIYDYFMRPRIGYSIVDFFSKNRVQKYLYRGATESDHEKIARVDTLVLAYKGLTKNTPGLLFGYGIGNVMPSYFESLQGAHVDKQKYGATQLALTLMLWEVGFLGVMIYVAFLFCFFKDALLMRRTKGLFGSFALGWCAVVVIIGICLVYKNLLEFNVINLLFWYFSGVIAAKAARLKSLQAREAERRPAFHNAARFEASISSAHRLQVK